MRRLPSLQLILFVAVVLLPGALVLGMAQRLTRQDRALADRNREEARRLFVADVGQRFLAHLEGIRIQELRTPERGVAHGVVLRARLEDGRPVFPWDDLAAPPVPLEGGYAAMLRNAERLEFAGESARSVEAYREALRSAPPAGSGAAARLGLARSLERMGDTAGAAVEYAVVLDAADDVRDEQGVRLALYAADRLSRSGAGGRRRALRHLEETLEEPGALGPLEAYLLRDLAGEMEAGADGTAAGLVPRAEEAVARVEQALALQRDLPALLRVSLRNVRDTDPIWLPYGDPLWLVGVPPVSGGGDSTLLVVDAATALRTVLDADPDPEVTEVAFAPPGSAEGDPLHGSLPGLRATAVAPGVQGGPGDSALLLLVPLVLGATIFTAWLLWRDMRREVAAVRMRSLFVSSVSHELKTPLTSIRMFAETLQRGPGDDPERRREHLDTIVGETERLSRLINNVLDFSRLELGGRSYRREPVRLGDVVREAERAMAYPLAQGGFSLEVGADEELTVEADRDAVLQAVLNLLGNAVKFSGDSRRIELDVSRRNGDALVRVTDGGIGIRPEDRSRIFEDFFRSEEAERLGITGTGLGLPLVRHVARAHGGDVEVESRPGAGSSFTLRLPLGEGA